MQRYVETNKDLSLKIPFLVDGEFVTPTSASLTLEKNDGTKLLDAVALTISVNATSSVYEIVAVHNVSTLAHELRYLSIEYVYDSKTYFYRNFYTIIANQRLPVVEDDVRNLVGLMEGELTDGQIDVYGAYIELKGDTTTNIDNILTGGSKLVPDVQRAIKAKAALNSLVFIETLIFQSEQSDNTLYKRFTPPDYEKMLKRLEDLYTSSLLGIEGTDSTDVTASASFLISTGTDIITGA